jgi:hypothetical protein
MSAMYHLALLHYLHGLEMFLFYTVLPSFTFKALYVNGIRVDLATCRSPKFIVQNAQFTFRLVSAANTALFLHKPDAVSDTSRQAFPPSTLFNRWVLKRRPSASNHTTHCGNTFLDIQWICCMEITLISSPIFSWRTFREQELFTYTFSFIVPHTSVTSISFVWSRSPQSLTYD